MAIRNEKGARACVERTVWKLTIRPDRSDGRLKFSECSCCCCVDAMGRWTGSRPTATRVNISWADCPATDWSVRRLSYTNGGGSDAGRMTEPFRCHSKVSANKPTLIWANRSFVPTAGKKRTHLMAGSVRAWSHPIPAGRAQTPIRPAIHLATFRNDSTWSPSGILKIKREKKNCTSGSFRRRTCQTWFFFYWNQTKMEKLLRLTSTFL